MIFIYSFVLTQKNQKLKTVEIFAKFHLFRRKILKLATLKQQNFLSATRTKFLTQYLQGQAGCL